MDLHRMNPNFGHNYARITMAIKKASQKTAKPLISKVPRIGIEPMTRGFSVFITYIPAISLNFLSV
jgi:hypothetical protein